MQLLSKSHQGPSRDCFSCAPLLSSPLPPSSPPLLPSPPLPYALSSPVLLSLLFPFFPSPLLCLSFLLLSSPLLSLSLLSSPLLSLSFFLLSSALSLSLWP